MGSEPVDLRGQLSGVLFLLPPVDSGDGTQALRLRGNLLYLLNHLAGPCLFSRQGFSIFSKAGSRTQNPPVSGSFLCEITIATTMAAPFGPSCLPFVYSVSLLVNWLLGFWRQDIGCRSRQEQLVKRTKEERHPRIQFTFPADQRSRDLNTADNVDNAQDACKDNLCFPKDFFQTGVC